MSHTTDLIYRDSTHGISLADIAYVLGDNTDMARSPKINKWAKNKPMPFATPTSPSEAQKKAINYGLVAPAATTSPATAYTGVWSYPPIASTDFSRVLDFDNYYQEAKPPFIPVGDREYSPAQGSSIAINDNSQGRIADAYSVQMSDLGELTGWYKCIALLIPGGAVFKTLELPDNWGGDIIITQNELTTYGYTDEGENVDFVICACNEAFTNFTSLSEIRTTTRFRSLPSDELLINNLEIKSGLPLNWQANETARYQQVSGGVPGRNWRDATPYVDMTEAGQDGYMPFTDPNYALQMAFDVKNTSEQDVTLVKAQITSTFLRTFADSSGVAYLSIKGLYTIASDGTPTEASTITIPAGQTVAVGIAFADQILARNSYGSQVEVVTGQTFETTVKLFQYGRNNANQILSFQLRVKN